MYVKAKGFTLIELMVVLLLFSIAAGLTFSQFSFLQRGYVKAELDGLYQACLYMQRHAMLSNQSCSLNIDLAQQRYTFNGRTQKLATGVQFGVKQQAKGPPSTPTKQLTTPCTFQGNKITFYPDGIIASGSVYMTDKHHTCLYALTVAVSPYSYLRKYRYDDKWQLV